MSGEDQLVVDRNKRSPGDIVHYLSVEDTIRTATVQRWVESTIVAIDTESNEEVVFDQYDHIQWLREPY